MLALWLIGLGIGLIYNRLRHPQENGAVERFHALVEPWGEPEQCPNFAAWQERLAWLSRTQRERYPAVGKQSRIEAFPDLVTVARPYDPLKEAQHWDLERVKTYLAQGLWNRRVDQAGRITLYHIPYRVSRALRGQRVFVGFDPPTSSWVVQDRTGREIRRHVAREITAETIMNLEVTDPKAAYHSE